MFRRVAVSARAVASGAGHSELSIAISEEKKVYETAVKLIAAKTDAAVYSYKWARSEPNKVIQDVFLKMSGLTSVWAEAQNEFVHEYKQYRGSLKELLQEEKGIDDVRKQQNSCASRLTKLKKQVEVARRKNDPSKLEPLLAELKQAAAANDKAYEEVEEKVDYVEAFKARRLRESLVSLSQAYLTLANRMTEIFSAQMRMAELITSDSVPNSNAVSDAFSYEACYEKSRKILEETCLKLSFPVPRLPGDRTSTLRTYVDRDSSSPEARSSPHPTSPSTRSPLPPPSQLRHAKIPFGATSLDEDIYASADDVTTQMPPEPPPRPIHPKPEYVEPDEQIVSAKKTKPVDKYISKSANDAKREGATGRSDDYSKVQDMYEWVWQRQSTILSSGDSGEYTVPFDVLPERQAAGSHGGHGKALKVIQETTSGEYTSKEDSEGYLVPSQAVNGNKTKSSDKQGKPQSAAQQSNESDASCTTHPDDSGEYSYARVMTTSAKPFVRSSNSARSKEPPKSTSRPDVPPRPSRLKQKDSQGDETLSSRIAKAASDSDGAASS